MRYLHHAAILSIIQCISRQSFVCQCSAVTQPLHLSNGRLQAYCIKASDMWLKHMDDAAGARSQWRMAQLTLPWAATRGVRQTAFLPKKCQRQQLFGNM